MIVRQIGDTALGELVVTPDDRIGRADARLVSLLSRINRVIKGTDSLYHCEDVFKHGDHPILKFDWTKKDELIKIVRLNSFSVITK
jgi:hypothetical protein